MTNYLDDIINFLKTKRLIFHNENKDGRINSATNEKQVLTAIKEQFTDIYLPNMRSWYDFSIQNQNEIFVNIKISDLNNGCPDNCSSKLGLGYTLTGIKNLPNSCSWRKFHETLKNELKIGFDYYF